MNKISYLVLMIGLILIVFIFSLFSGINIFTIIGIILVIVFLLILSSMILVAYTRERKFKKIKNEVSIYSYCYINDEVNFSRLMNIIDEEKDFKLEGYDCCKFIKLLLDNKLVIKLDSSMDIREVIEKINELLLEYKIDLNIDLDVIIEKDTESIKYRRENKLETFIYDLNIITSMIRKVGYELVQLYPVKMKPNKIKYYMMIVPITSLLDLNEIGYMG